MELVGIVPVGRAEPRRSAARPSREDKVTLVMAGSERSAYPSFPVVCLTKPYAVLLAFVGDYAGGNRSLVRVCFYRLKTAAFYLATSPSRTGRP